MNRFSAFLFAGALVVAGLGTFKNAAAVDELAVVGKSDNRSVTGAYAERATGTAARKSKAPKSKAIMPLTVYGPMQLVNVKAFNGFQCDPGAAEVDMHLAVQPAGGSRLTGTLNYSLNMKGTGNTKQFRLKTKTGQAGVVHSIGVVGRFKGDVLNVTYQDTVTANGWKACIFTRGGYFVKQ